MRTSPARRGRGDRQRSRRPHDRRGAAGSTTRPRPADGHHPARRLARRPYAATCASWSGGTARAFAVLVAVNTVAVIASMVGPVSARRAGRGPRPTGDRDLHLERTVAAVRCSRWPSRRCSSGMVRLRGRDARRADAGGPARGLPRTVGGAAAGRAGAGRHRRSALPDHHGHRPAGQRDARGGAAAGHRRGVGGAAARRAHRDRAAAGAVGAGRPAAAARRLPLVLPAGPARLPLGGRRLRGGRRGARRDRRRRAHHRGAPARRPPRWRCPSGGSGSGRPGSATRCGCASVLFPVDQR